jgi:hypothetical protein
MLWTVVVPGALIPAAFCNAVIDAARNGQGGAPITHLPRLLATARLEPPHAAAARFEGAAHLDTLWQTFGSGTEPAAAAAGAWRALFDTPPPPHLWHADPVHFSFARDHYLVEPLPDADRYATEFATLAEAASESLQAAGARLHVSGTRGLIAFDRAWQLDTTPLDCALGESVQARMPEGADAVRWRRLLSEIQMVWHQHPVNEAREARGAPAINALWLHGEGSLDPVTPRGPRRAIGTVVSSEPAVRGWALAANVPAAQVHADLDRPVRDNALLLWPGLFAPCKAEAWGAWLPVFSRFDAWIGGLAEQAAQAGARIDLLLAGRRQTRRVLIHAADRLKPWRRIGADARFATLFADADLPDGARA